MSKPTTNSNALINFDDVRSYIGALSNNMEVQVVNAINVVSSMFDEYCGRGLKVRKVRKEIHRNPGSKILLENWPLVRLDDVVTGFEIETATGTVDSGSTTTLVDAARTEADDYWNGAMISVELSTDNWESADVNDFVASTDTISVLTKDAFSEAIATGDSYKLTLKKTSNYYTLIDSDYNDFDFKRGVITLAGSHSLLVVNYSGGYVTIPKDLKQAAIWQVLEFISPEKNENVTRKSIGGLSVDFEQGKGLDKMTQKVKNILDNYRERLIA